MTDYISRADAICEVLVNDGIDNIVDRINALPSADAVYGKWIPIEETLPTYDGGEKTWITGMKCSNCGKLFDLRVGYYYCPSCGAKMKGGDADMGNDATPKYMQQSRHDDGRMTTEHDKEWIIGCIKHDGFIKTNRFDKANQIILEALQFAEHFDLLKEHESLQEVVRCKDCRFNKHPSNDLCLIKKAGIYPDDDDFRSYGKRREP